MDNLRRETQRDTTQYLGDQLYVQMKGDAAGGVTSPQRPSGA